VELLNISHLRAHMPDNHGFVARDAYTEVS
jgi:hypothetical protein